MEWGFIEPYLPIGEYGPYPVRLRQQFEGVLWRFRTGGQWRGLSGSRIPGCRDFGGLLPPGERGSCAASAVSARGLRRGRRRAG
nr:MULTISPECIES: transposase [Streptomyces]